MLSPPTLVISLSRRPPSEATKESVILPPPWNPNKYKTVDDWITSKEYQEYLQKKKE